MQNNEEVIIKQLKEGREEAYRYLFDHHYAVLCVIATQYVHDDFIAETIVADVFFHIWQRRDSLSIDKSLRSYLAQSVRNGCIDWLKQKHVQHETDTLPDSTLRPAEMTDDAHPLGNLLDKELETIIDLAIKRLPDDCRRVFCMSRFDGKKNGEIAQALGISVNTVKYHIKHALQLLRTDLQQYLEMLFFIIITQN